jgi:hypothetical protein
MARKLFLFLAFISLVALAQAPPGLAATIYNLESGAYDWIEKFPEGGTPGSTGSEFSGWHTWGDGGHWIIGGEVAYNPNGTPYKISSPIKVTDRTGGPGETVSGSLSTFVYTYDDSVVQNEERFIVNIPDGPDIFSMDFELTVTATYRYTGSSGQLWYFQNGSIEGVGTNFYSDGTPFTVSGTLRENSGGGNTHYGYIENFKLTYPASTVPVPGAVWLLGTGLLGLFCLGRRRQG